MGDEISRFEFLDSDDSEENFANCDFALRAGRHIQNHHRDYKIFDYISNNTDELIYFYRKLYGVSLQQGTYHDEKYYYLDFDPDSRGKFSAARTDKLSTRHILFGILLLKIHRVDNHFGKQELNVNALKESLKEGTDNYSLEIYRLFAKVSSKNNATEVDESNIDTWIDNSLKKFDEIGWVYFHEDEDAVFSILPSFNRLFQIYFQEIKNFDQLTGAS